MLTQTNGNLGMTKTDRQKLRDVALITGPAGAGRTTAINALADIGFEAIDNLPISFLNRLIAGDESTTPIAIGIDPRTRDFSAQSLSAALNELSQHENLSTSLVFVDCGTNVLLRRFSETRRRHPLSSHETLLDGILTERAMLAPLREQADILIDTTEMSPHELRAELGRWFSQETGPGLSISLQSFSYKRGTPRSADMVIDCRFLRNPHWQEELRALTGSDPAVASYVKKDSNFHPFYSNLLEMLKILLPAYKAEGKSYFTLALGCTGGKHRSVCITESVAESLAQDGWQVSIRHRELERNQSISDSKNLVAS